MALWNKTAEEKLVDAMGKLQGQLDGVLTALGTADDAVEREKLTRELQNLRIQMDREKENWAREKRETEHMVGLQKKRGEQEAEMAAKEAGLKVREEHMGAKEEAFEVKLSAIVKPLEDQLKYMQDKMVEQLLARLPKFNIDTVFNPHGALPPAKSDD